MSTALTAPITPTLGNAIPFFSKAPATTHNDIATAYTSYAVSALSELPVTPDQTRREFVRDVFEEAEIRPRNFSQLAFTNPIKEFSLFAPLAALLPITFMHFFPPQATALAPTLEHLPVPVLASLSASVLAYNLALLAQGAWSKGKEFFPNPAINLGVTYFVGCVAGIAASYWPGASALAETQGASLTLGALACVLASPLIARVITEILGHNQFKANKENFAELKQKLEEIDSPRQNFRNVQFELSEDPSLYLDFLYDQSHTLQSRSPNDKQHPLFKVRTAVLLWQIEKANELREQKRNDASLAGQQKQKLLHIMWAGDQVLDEILNLWETSGEQANALTELQIESRLAKKLAAFGE